MAAAGVVVTLITATLTKGTPHRHGQNNTVITTTSTAKTPPPGTEALSMMVMVVVVVVPVTAIVRVAPKLALPLPP